MSDATIDPYYYYDQRMGQVRRSAYTDEVLYEAEMKKIFESTWLYVAHGSEIPNPGDYKTTSLAGRPVIVSRGSNGEVNIVHNRCRHRGASVCQASTGNAKFFRCEYHGWTYKNDGALIGVTYPDGYPGIEKGALGLLRVPKVDVYQDFIFASLNEEVEPLEDHLGGAREFIDLFVESGGGRPLVAQHGTQQLKYSGNWKYQLENGCDGYHPTFAHRSFFRVIGARTQEESAGSYFSGAAVAKARSLGNGHSLLDQRSSVGDHYTKRALLAPDADDIAEELRKTLPEGKFETEIGHSVHLGFNLTVFPNLQLIGIHIREIVPTGAMSTTVKYTPLTIDGAPDGINQLRLRSHELFYSAAGFGVPDDGEMFRRVSLGLDSDTEWLLLSRGMKREYVQDEIGESHITDELPQRTEWNRWAELMAKGGK